MSKIKITFPDGIVREMERGVRAEDILKEVAPDLAKEAFAAEVNGQVVDLSHPITTDASVRFVTFAEKAGRDIYRHSTGHIMAQAVQNLFPGAKVTIGGWVDERYYYDFDVPRPFTPEDFEQIEARMKEIVTEDQTFLRKDLSKDEAKRLFQGLGESYKLEVLEEIPPDEVISVYWNDDKWVDLCKGPHVPSTGKIKAFKIMSSSSTYWRGDERNQKLQRLYVTAFPSEEELQAYLHRLEEMQRRDHRKIGPQLGLFTIEEDIGPGLVLWLPNGAIVREVIENFLKDELKRRGYQFVVTPHVARAKLWEISGHLSWYRDNMFSGMDVEGQEYLVKPMNCPFHIMIYKSQTRSYRDLPLRIAEMGTVYRYERSGVLHGLLRVRGLTQDDAHIFCTPEQIEHEVYELFDLTYFVLKRFGFEDYEVVLSLRDPAHQEQYAGSAEIWQQAEAALEAMIEKLGIGYQRMEGEAAFYGPKIDVFVSDALGRKWQCTTIQLDFNLPERFDLEYAAPDGTLRRPVMIHRAIIGSFERFIGVLIEHYAGAFPLWLSPVQVAIAPVADRHVSYAEQVAEQLRAQGLRVEVMSRSETVSAKILDAETRKIPYILVVGDREQKAGTVSVRQRGRKDLGAMSLQQFLELILPEARGT